jgi:ribulose 1,5-bisphosphate synthetase/thiazole synthase
MNNEKMKFNIVIVGSGFAGLKAANMLADSSLSVLLVDENIHLGGQLLRNIPSSLGRHTAYRPDYV